MTYPLPSLTPPPPAPRPTTTDGGFADSVWQRWFSAMATTVKGLMQKNFMVTPQDFMTASQISDVAAGTLLVDVTAAVQAAMNYVSANKVMLLCPAGSYLCGPLFIKSNSTIILEAGTLFQARAGFAAGDRFWNLTNVSNVTIDGHFGTLNMPKAEYVSGEQRHACFITGCTDIRISDLNANASGGDGFYIGAVPLGAGCLNITIDNCYANNNRRQGMSITNAENVWVRGGLYSNTTGTAPAAGIDVEPDVYTDAIKNINLIGVKTKGNDGCGILLALSALTQGAGQTASVNVIDCESTSDGAIGNAAIRFVGSNAPLFQVKGQINVRNFKALFPNSNGFGWSGWHLMPDLIVDDPYVYNPGTAPVPNTVNGKCGYYLYTGFDPNGNDNITLRNARAVDDRGGGALMYSAFYLSGPVALSNCRFIDCVGTGMTQGPDCLILGTMTNCSWTYTNPPVVAFSGNTGQMYRYPGKIITQATSGVLTFDVSAGTLQDLEYTFMNTLGTTMQIRPVIGDTILQYGHSAGNDVVLREAGDMIKIKSLGGTLFQVTAQTGHFSPLGFLQPCFTFYQQTPPVVGTFNLGDRVITNDPSIGQPKSWVCTAAGTPGTWVSEGNL